MCATCEKAKKLPVDRALEVVARAIEAGRDAEHFRALLDGLLGTEMEERDPDLDGAWERGHRGGER